MYYSQSARQKLFGGELWKVPCPGTPVALHSSSVAGQEPVWWELHCPGNAPGTSPEHGAAIKLLPTLRDHGRTLSSSPEPHAPANAGKSAQ